MIQEKELKEIVWDEISIQRWDDKTVLLLVCQDEKSASDLHFIISTNPYDIDIHIGKDKNYIITLNFLNTDHALRFESSRTEQNYPPATWLKNGQVTHITTALWQERGRYIPIPELLDLTCPINFN